MALLRALDVGTLWQAATFCILVWLAVFFGRTLAPGKMPLIERIARVSEPALKPSLARYTRHLTLAWCVYFIAGALLTVAVRRAPFPLGPCVGLGAVAFFVGEHWVRRRIFPGDTFPGLMQQLRDTWKVWH